MTFQEELEDLKKEFNELKTAYQNPQLYIWNHFSLIRNEIDTSANQHLLTHNLDELEERQVIDNWLLMIDQVKRVESLSLEAFTQEFSNSQIESELDSIESELNRNLVFFVKDRLKSIWKSLEELFFLNTTVVFLDKQEYLKHELARQQSRLESQETSEFFTYSKLDFNIFDKMNEKTTFGKLLVLNEHFSKQNWDVLR